MTMSELKKFLFWSTAINYGASSFFGLIWCR